MAEVITYLLGAGASAGSLPVSKTVPTAMVEFLGILKEHLEDLNFCRPRDKSRPVDSMKQEPAFREAINWLVEETTLHSSIDTYAKKLILTNDLLTLTKMKATFSAFLILLQSYRRCDVRYDSFFATILQNNSIRPPTIPPNIRILTWNYDLQLEKGYLPFVKNNVAAARSNIGGSSNVLRINGIAGRSPPYDHFGVTNVALTPFSIESVLAVLEMWGAAISDLHVVSSDLEFAWEQKDYTLERGIRPLVADTTILVIVGYSFPFFNREVDQFILNAMPVLRKVYVQVPEQQHGHLRDRLLATRPSLPDAAYIADTERFYVPYEL